MARKRSLGVLLAVGAILGGAFSGPPASAQLVKDDLAKDVTDTVGSTVRSVQAGANALPSPPSQIVPTKPKKPPPVTQPQVSAEPPAKSSTPPPSQTETSSRAKGQAPPTPSSNDVAGTVRGTVDSVITTGSENLNGPATSGHSGDLPAAVAKSGAKSEADQFTIRERRPAASSPVAVRPNEVVTLQRWLARVWPAVALGGSWGDEVGAVEVLAREVLRPALTAVTGALLASSPIPTTGEPALAGRHGVAGASRSSSDSQRPLAAVDEGWKIAYLIAIAALLALLAFTVWREFRIALHPGLH